ncbi:glycosyltransferase family 4 protein [Marinactinospora rubrisoli]|uniref:Glycosyltransferase family 4 protein n=1 Tax=Marinactinospora rubrisoli TaxID=2715399 RepID=A0ABW2KPA0_9ACTN
MHLGVPGTPAARPGPVRILVVAVMSGRDPRGGGLAAFNQDFTRALAREHDVTLLTTESFGDHGAARTVTIGPGSVDLPDGVADVPHARLVGLGRRHRPEDIGLGGASERYDLVVAHSLFLDAAATELRRLWYPGTPVAHVLHTAPERYQTLLGRPEEGRSAAHHLRRVMSRADILGGVGRLLTDEAVRLGQGSGRTHPSHEIVPGAEIRSPGGIPPLDDGMVVTFRGRLGDPIKGHADLLGAARMLHEGGQDVRFHSRGADPETWRREQTAADAAVGAPGVVRVAPFTSDEAELERDLHGAHLMVMPSLHEGFGLAAWEAAARGLPVLVSEESGVARFLTDPARVPPEVGRPCVVRDAGLTGEARSRAWAQAILRARAELPLRWHNARRLHTILGGYSWDDSARAFVNGTLRTPLTRHTVQVAGGALHSSASPAGRGEADPRVAMWGRPGARGLTGAVGRAVSGAGPMERPRRVGAAHAARRRTAGG